MLDQTTSRFRSMPNATQAIRAIRLGSILLIALSIGCSSIKSTLVTRDASNQKWNKIKKLRGIPITLKVPTHLKVYIFDKHFLEKITVGERDVIKPVEIDVPLRDFATEIIKTDKIFTVDFKRPAAGSSNVGVQMNDQQYFEKIQQDITDTTLSTIRSELLPAVNKTGKGFVFEPASGMIGGVGWKEMKSLVAVGMFELDDPLFEQKVSEFIDCHLNKAHDALVVPPGVSDSVHRVGISGNPTNVTPLCGSGNCTCAECVENKPSVNE